MSTCMVTSVLNGQKIPADLPSLPSSEDFVAAISASLEKAASVPSSSAIMSSSNTSNITNCTVVQKGGRRGYAYVDFATENDAEAAVEACSKFPATLPGEGFSGWMLTVEVKSSAAAHQKPEQQPKPEQQQPKAAPTVAAAAAPAAASSTSAVPAGFFSTNTSAISRRPVAAAAKHHPAPTNNANNNSDNAQQNQQQQQQQLAQTLFVRCKRFSQIFHIFDFFRSHNITGHADDCVRCDASKKPYFLVEWGKNVGSYQACLFLDGSMFEGEEVAVKPSSQTAAEYKAKKPDALSLATKRAAQIRQREEEVTVAAETSMMPISVLLKRPPPPPPPES